MEPQTQQKIQELQMLEQGIQGLLSQKQPIQGELAEVENSLNEITKTKSDVYKVVGQIMIKSTPDELKKELDEKKQAISLRLNTLEDQEKELTSKIEKLRNEITKEIK